MEERMYVQRQFERMGYSPEEAAKVVGLSRGGIYNLMASGKLRSVKIGRRRIIPASALAELLEGPDAA
jgi:excisionase family DNA binding protein